MLPGSGGHTVKKIRVLNSHPFLNRIRSNANTTTKVSRRFLGQFADAIGSINLSIRAKILISLSIVILIMGSTNGLLVGQVLNYSRQYDAIITNITTANSISGSVKPDIDTEMWKIVAGKVDFDAGEQYNIINGVNLKLEWMMANTDSPKAKIKLEGIRRTMLTLTETVDQMGVQMENHSTAAENEELLENIWFVTAVVEDVVQDYALFEVHRTESQYEVMRAGFARWESLSVALMGLAIAFSVLAAWSLSRSIYKPIKKLHDVTATITRNDLQALVNRDNVDEITELGLSFNIMIGKIRDLLDSKIKEQENLKKAELRALQAQINPHFLYNTLDTIIWMAKAKKTEQVIEIVTALSTFFRISLSKGKDWITIEEEVERTRSYLTIQKMRYNDIMDFKIELDEAVAQNTVLKLTLQPLVENALYHGIKNKRQGGTIHVRARRKGLHEVLFEVEDNGIGFTPEKLAQLEVELADDSGDIRMETGVGIGNVNKRIRLYYGKQYGISIRSEYNAGTLVTLVIPAKVDEDGQAVFAPNAGLNYQADASRESVV
ncbi:MAG: two-component sensor histidine kinase [Chloroflexi bacterium HGW-Chloroflexi-10]|nr:MAG: two-component sensor histidine kinase [Chloroflexi bacterium HGW-Chloroflexi-10]